MPDIKIDTLGTLIMKACEEFSCAPKCETTGKVKDASDRVVSSTYLRKDYRIRHLTKLGYYIPPKMLPLMIPEKNANGALEYKQVGPKRFFAFVSPTSICRLMLQNKSLRIAIERQRITPPNSQVKKSILDSKEQHDRLAGTFMLEANLDDTNLSLSNMKSSQKFLFVYLGFPCLPFEFRTKPNNIFVVMMVRRKMLKLLPKDKQEFAFALLFRRLRNELAILLKEGVTIDGKNYQISLSTINADNLAQYEFLGFGQNFKKTAFICRMCGAPGLCKHRPKPPAKKKITKKAKKDADVELEQIEPNPELPPWHPGQTCTECRSIQEKDTHRELLKPSDLETDEGRKLYGHRRPFPLKGLPGIYPTNISPCDPFHDQVEGVLPDLMEWFFAKIKSTIKTDFPKKTKPQIQLIFDGLIDSTDFYEGKPSVRIMDKKDEIKIDGKGVQVFIAMNLFLSYNFTYFTFQKLELFLRLESIFYQLKIDTKVYNLETLLGKEGADLYFSLKRFTLLTFSQELTKDDILKLKKGGFEIIRNLRLYEAANQPKQKAATKSKQTNAKQPKDKITDKRSQKNKEASSQNDQSLNTDPAQAANEQIEVNTEEEHDEGDHLEGSQHDTSVWAKLHHLIHYWQLCELYGVLYAFATWHYETKHQDAKFLARRMCNFTNLAYSVSEKLAILQAAAFEEIDYFNVDLFPEDTSDRCATLDDSGYSKLVSSNGYAILDKVSPKDKPFQLKANVLYRLPNPRGSWLYAYEFQSGGQDGKEVFCRGNIFSLKRENSFKRPTLDLGGPMPELEISKKNVLISCKYIETHQKDFLFKLEDSSLKCKCQPMEATKKSICKSKLCDGAKFFLVNWIHNK